MKKNKEIFNESSEKPSTWLCHSVYCKKSKLCIQNGVIYIEDLNKLKIYIEKCSPKHLSSNSCNVHINGLYNNGTIKFMKLIVIYQLLMLQISVVMGQSEKKCSNLNTNSEQITYFLCEFCDKFSIIPSCTDPAVSISVTVFFFLFVITMFSLICCNCGRKKNMDEYAEYGRFIMGPDGKMYDRLMMNPQMLQDGKIPEELVQEGMQGPELQEPEMQETGRKEPGMQHTERKNPRIKPSKLQETDMNENGNKHKNKKRSTDYNNPNDDELHVGYKPF